MAQDPQARPEDEVLYDGPGPARQMYGPNGADYRSYPQGGSYNGSGGNGNCGRGCQGQYCCEGDWCAGDCCGGGYADCCEGCGDDMCGYGDACGPSCAVYVDWLYLRASGADVAHAQQQNGIGGAGTVPFGNVGSVETEEDSGIRTGVNLACGPCSSILVTYTFFETDAFNVVEPPVITGGGGAVGSLVHHPGAALTASAGPVLGTHDIDFQLADMLYRSALSCGPSHSINYLIGLQYGDLEQGFTQTGVFSGGQQGVIDTFTTIDFDGGGLKAGVDVDRRLGGGFSVYGRLTGAVMSGEFNSRYTMNNFTTDELLAHAHWKDNRIVSQVEYEIGFGWCCPSEHWRLSTGYMFSHWMNVVTTPVFIDAVQADNYTDVDDTLTFDGFVTRLECRF